MLRNLCLYLLFIALMVGTSLFSFGVNPIINYAFFNSPQNGSYIEMHMLIPSTSVTFASTANGKFQANVEVLITFSQADKIVQFDKYQLNSEMVDSLGAVNFNLLDVKRYPLKKGAYNFAVECTDLNMSSNPTKPNFPFQQNIEVPDFSSTNIQFADVIFLDEVKPTTQEKSYSRNGFDMLPNVLNFFPENNNELRFYTEWYNTDKVLANDEEYLVIYNLVNSRGKTVKNFQKFKKQRASTAQILLDGFKIDKLGSGNYELSIQVKNRKNETLAETKKFFQRSKKIAPLNAIDFEDLTQLDISNTFVQNLSDEEVAYYLEATYPISKGNTQQFLTNVIQSNDMMHKRSFLYNFWVQQDPFSPDEAFLYYKQRVDKADKLYSLHKQRGFQTDQGRVMLQYGDPNDVLEVDSESSTSPYEIWHYYSLNNNGKQRDVRFVFYQEIRGLRYFELIHSDAIGEINNPDWKREMYERVGRMPLTDNPIRQGIYGSRTGDLFNNTKNGRNGDAVQDRDW